MDNNSPTVIRVVKVNLSTAVTVQKNTVLQFFLKSVFGQTYLFAFVK